MTLPLVISLLAGCAVGPDYASPTIALPRHWSNDKGKPPQQASVLLAQWWLRLDDPLLNQLIDEAVQGNLDAAAAKARIREARALLQQSIGALFPLISGSGSATANRTAATTGVASDGAGAITHNQFQAGFDSTWELDLFGANRRAVEAATYNVEASEDDLRAILLTLIGDVASYYIEARGHQARAALARRTAASQRATAALTQNKVNAGSASAVDAAKAVAQAASTEANVPTSEASYRQSVHRLGVLLGRDPAALAARLERATAIPAPRLPLPKGIPADVLTMRPDVRKAERQLAQYTAKIGKAEAALYPDVSLSGSVSTTALKLGDLGRNPTIGWSIGPTLSVPIFNGGKLRAAVEVAQAQRDEYHIAWRGAVLKALEDVENAIVALAQERIRIRSLAESAQRGPGILLGATVGSLVPKPMSRSRGHRSRSSMPRSSRRRSRSRPRASISATPASSRRSTGPCFPSLRSKARPRSVMWKCRRSMPVVHPQTGATGRPVCSIVSVWRVASRTLRASSPAANSSACRLPAL